VKADDARPPEGLLPNALLISQCIAHIFRLVRLLRVHTLHQEKNPKPYTPILAQTAHHRNGSRVRRSLGSLKASGTRLRPESSTSGCTPSNRGAKRSPWSGWNRSLTKTTRTH